MPRFNEQEKEAINKALMNEGEKLFSELGLRKVTVDELAEAVNISKGSFYSFYNNKEHLYIRINFKLQNMLFEQVKIKLKENMYMKKDELLVLGLKLLVQGFLNHPILMVDITTWEYIRRKLPVEYFEENIINDGKMLETFLELGIKFSEPKKFIVKLFQFIFLCLGDIKEDPDQKKIIDTLIRGIVQQIIII